jgi:hypothetical protein
MPSKELGEPLSLMFVYFLFAPWLMPMPCLQSSVVKVGSITMNLFDVFNN